VRIVRVANFVGPRSGGLRTALRELGRGYRAAGHEPVLVVPGPAFSDADSPQGRVVTLPAPTVPGTGGYRVILGRRRLAALLDALEPDRLEVSDRSTLRWLGHWARRRGVRSIVVSHERLDALLALGLPGWAPHRAVADSLNARMADAYDRVVCTTQWAAAEFRRIGTPNLLTVPLGVDLAAFGPERHDPALRARLARPSELLLVHCGRLSPEKRVDRSIATLAELRRRGVPAVLVVAGDGPRRAALQRQAAGLPVRFVGFVAGREALARLLATADVVVAPGPVETFGLAALEALASGTPVVAAGEGALAEVVGRSGGAGVVVSGEAPRFADGVLQVAAAPAEERRAAARHRAEELGWDASVSGMLAAHAATGCCLRR